jgi:hypothetical protein
MEAEKSWGCCVYVIGDDIIIVTRPCLIDDSDLAAVHVHVVIGQAGAVNQYSTAAWLKKTLKKSNNLQQSMNTRDR